MDDERLIELVRENSVLYDPTHPKYMDPKFKVAVWNAIGDELNVTGTQCKGRWSSIRDHFRRLSQKRKNMTSDAEKMKQYKYEEYLQFLVPFITDKDTSSNNTLQETPSMSGEIDDSREAPMDELSDAETSQPQISVRAPRRISRRGRSKFLRSHFPSTPPETPSAMLMRCLLDKGNPENVTRLPFQDDIDTFLIGIASTIKKLNPYHQHIAKGRIFNVVHELEAQEFFNQPPYSSNVSCRLSNDNDPLRSNGPT